MLDASHTVANIRRSTRLIIVGSSFLFLLLARGLLSGLLLLLGSGLLVGLGLGLRLGFCLTDLTLVGLVVDRM